MAPNSHARSVIEHMRKIQQQFFEKFGVDDIWSNSKVFEIVIASALNHELIPGHSGSSDARDAAGNVFEYKHYKENSSNHSWTFNDFSDTTIQKLENLIDFVYFCHIDDSLNPSLPTFDWYFKVPGSKVASYLRRVTPNVTNARKMINISRRQLTSNHEFLNLSQSEVVDAKRYGHELTDIFKTVKELEQLVGVENALTSSKFWEIIVALELQHKVNSEQGGRSGAHDAQDIHGNWFEYKISKSTDWNFQDISPAVLEKYRELSGFILATVDKKNILVQEIWCVEPELMIAFLIKKLDEKISKFANQGKTLRRLQVTVSRREISNLGAQQLEINA